MDKVLFIIYQPDYNFIKIIMIRQVKYIREIFIYSLKRFITSNNFNYSSVLCITTLLSLIPIIGLMLLTFSSIPLTKGYMEKSISFFIDNNISTLTPSLTPYLTEALNRMQEISLFTALFLISTALYMVYSVESAINSIWNVWIRRSGWRSLIIYLFILLVLPILLALSMTLSTYILSFQFLPEKIGKIISSYSLEYLTFILDILSSFIICFIFYQLLPNYKVKVKYSLIGAFCAMIGLIILKWLFKLYLSQYDTYALLYGAFASIPVFIIWLEIIWLTVLFGAEITHSLTFYCKKNDSKLADNLTHTIIWMKHIHEFNKREKTITFDNIRRIDNYQYSLNPKKLLWILIELKILTIGNNGNISICIDIEHKSLYEVIHMLPWSTPEDNQLPWGDPYLIEYCNYIKVLNCKWKELPDVGIKAIL